MNTPQKSDSSFTHIKSKIKVVFLGDQSTGKTSILLRFMYEKFDEGQSATVGIDFMAKNFTVHNFHLRLQLWDTAGQQRFRSLIPTYLKDASIAFIIFDLTNARSFKNVREWIDLCQHNRKQKSVIVLVGNKLDVVDQRQVPENQARELAKSEGIPYFESSAKNNTNITEMFAAAAELYVRQIQGTDSLFPADQSSSKDIEKEKEKHAKVVQEQKNVKLKEQPIISGKKKAKKCC